MTTKQSTRIRIGVKLDQELVRFVRIFAAQHLLSLEAAYAELLRRGLKQREGYEHAKGDSR